MEYPKEKAALLVKIAFMGLWDGCAPQSEIIFKALCAARPVSPAPLLGLAMCMAHRGEYGKGAAFIEQQVLPRFAQDVHAQAWLGMLLCRDNQTARGQAVLRTLLRGHPPDDVRALAEQCLNQL